MSEVIRVHVDAGSIDHIADDFQAKREGLIIWVTSPKRRTIAVYAPGQYRWVERVNSNNANGARAHAS